MKYENNTPPPLIITKEDGGHHNPTTDLNPWLSIILLKGKKPND